MSLFLFLMAACLPDPAGSNLDSSDTTPAETGGESGNGDGETGDIDDDTGHSDDECECPQDYRPNPDQTECVTSTSTDPDIDGTVYTVCDAEGPSNSSGANYEEQSIPSDELFRSRHQAASVWACDPSSGEVSNEPLFEWIGMKSTFETSSTKQYLVGASAFDYFWVRIDEETVLANDTGLRSSGEFWWFTSLELDGGPHEIEVMGKNDSGDAFVAVDVLGPFVKDDLDSGGDLLEIDFEDKILWSTEQRVGTWFELGESSGYSCPEGTSLSFEGEEPLCVGEDTTDCL